VPSFYLVSKSSSSIIGQVRLIAWVLGGMVFSMTTICFFIMLFECKHVPYVGLTIGDNADVL
jgi:hypothetical protein